MQNPYEHLLCLQDSHQPQRRSALSQLSQLRYYHHKLQLLGQSCHPYIRYDKILLDVIIKIRGDKFENTIAK